MRNEAWVYVSNGNNLYINNQSANRLQIVSVKLWTASELFDNNSNDEAAANIRGNWTE